MHPPSARIALALSALFALGARADDAKDFVTQHLNDVVKTDLAQITDPAVAKTFGTPIFTATVTISDSDGGTQSNTLCVARSGEKVVALSRPGSDGDYPVLQKLFNPDLKLTGDDDARTVQKALDLVFPIIGDQDKAAESFKHDGNQWTFYRGVFFDKKLGFVLTTDANGTVTDVKFALKLP